MSDIYNTFPYYGYGTEDGSAYYKKPQPMDGEAVENAIDEKISDLVGSAPSDLDTIEELAAAVQTGSGDASDIYEKIDEVEAKIPTTVAELTDASDYAKTGDIPTSLDGLDNSETKYQSEDEVTATVEGAVEGLFASVEYDENEKKIIFKNGEGAEVGYVDATDFIKDGMVSGASIENGKLVITFNEESGSEDVELDLTDIFNPSNYYTATQCDEKYQPIGDYTTLDEVAQEGYTKFDGDYESLTNKPTIPEVPTAVSAFENDANYTTLDAVAAEGYTKFDGDYESLTNKPTIPEVPENVSAFNNDANYTTLDAVAAEGYTKFDGDYESLTNKPSIPGVPTDVSAFNNDANYTTLDAVAAEGYTKFDGDYESLTNKPTIPEVPENVSAFNNDANYTTLDAVAAEGYTKFDGDYESLTNKPTIPTVPENVSAFNNDANYTTLDAVAAEGYTKFDGDYESLTNKPTIPTAPVNVSELNNDAGYLDKETADEYYQPIGNYLTENALSDYYTGTYINEVFVDEQDLAHTLENYTTESDIASTVHDLVVRLNKLEAQNAVLVEKGTDSAEDIANMQDTENEDVVLATNSAIEALATPMTFNSVSIVGGEVGDDTVINTIAKDSVDINGLTVSGGYPEDENHNRLENGKIKYATREINISNLNIEPGCTVYNVFEGSQDMTADHSIDKFTAKNVTVNDTDLEHNVFNIYQLNSDAEVLIEDSTFNLNVAKSNVMRISNITNAENVTVTFKNIDLTYENKPYTSEDAAYAGLVIYQAYGNDLAFAGDTSKIGTWTFNFINCRYNGEVLTDNNFGTIKQLMYQYKVNNQGCEEPNAFNVVISAE